MSNVSDIKLIRTDFFFVFKTLFKNYETIFTKITYINQRANCSKHRTNRGALCTKKKKGAYS